MIVYIIITLFVNETSLLKHTIWAYSITIQHWGMMVTNTFVNVYFTLIKVLMCERLQTSIILIVYIYYKLSAAMLPAVKQQALVTSRGKAGL